MGVGSIPDWGTKIPWAMQLSQLQQKNVICRGGGKSSVGSQTKHHWLGLGNHWTLKNERINFILVSNLCLRMTEIFYNTK